MTGKDAAMTLRTMPLIPMMTLAAFLGLAACQEEEAEPEDTGAETGQMEETGEGEAETE